MFVFLGFFLNITPLMQFTPKLNLLNSQPIVSTNGHLASLNRYFRDKLNKLSGIAQMAFLKNYKV